jgi:magnesium chelatase family protein
MSPRAENLIEIAVTHFALSARAHDRILKLARTRADLEEHDCIEDTDVEIAVDCRMLDRRNWLMAHGTKRNTHTYFEKLLKPKQN